MRPEVQRYFPLHELIRKCDQILRFSATNFLTKAAKYLPCDFWGYLKTALLSKNCSGYFHSNQSLAPLSFAFMLLLPVRLYQSLGLATTELMGEEDETWLDPLVLLADTTAALTTAAAAAAPDIPTRPRVECGGNASPFR